MSRKTIRTVLAALVLAITVVAFAVYFTRHPEIIRTFRHISVLTLVALLLLYAVSLVALTWIQYAVLGLCGVRMDKKENALVVMYSAVINFFGPLQSGPAFRAVYLKARHNVNLKKYAVATLAYYGLFALFSGLFLLASNLGWWIIAIAIGAFLGAPLALKVRYFNGLDIRNVRQLALATLMQVTVQASIYFVELRSLVPGGISSLHALAYTGAANFALFVSLTPGAIGFREAFLMFSQKLHHFSTDIIAAASLLDRSVYIVFLLILAACIFGLHANEYLKTKQLKQDKAATESSTRIN